jgi:hypothetical protein
MRLSLWLPALGGLALAVLPVGSADKADSPPEEPTLVSWKKTVIDKTFRSEGVAVADVNKDGKMDVLVGDFWYEAPDWKSHEIRKRKKDYGNGDGPYSDAFACWAEDLNGDGWPDLIVIGFPGAPCHWYENPQGKDGHWKEHVICDSACNETPLYVDLFGTGKRVLLMGYKDKEIVWVAPGKDPVEPWEVHTISEPGKVAPGSNHFAHGLGAGDINGDGRLDVIVTAGWWEQPAKDADKPWTFHPAPLGDACADMYAFDIDGDGKADVISSSAHGYGIWWYQQKATDKSEPTFVKHVLFEKMFSQSHALHFVDINGDGLKDLVTGKRFWAHGSHGDPDPNKPAVLYWFEAKKGTDGVTRFLPHLIDDDSGIGTQFWVGDFNGDKLPDVVISNKKGVYLFEQVRK